MSELFDPGSAAANVAGYNTLFAALVAIALLVVALVAGLIVVFSVRFRKGTDVARHQVPSLVSREFEIGWTAATAFLLLFVFWWASSYGISQFEAPFDALEIHVQAKQWMWKTQHPSGAREINALHVPRGQPVVLTMASQDVIHSFFVPGLPHEARRRARAHLRDVVRAHANGRLPAAVREYCGTDHARMGGEIVVMEPEDYARWTERQPEADTLAREGQALFTAYGCSGCHSDASAVHAPSLVGVYGHPVPLSDGRMVMADEAYVRDSIPQPRRDVVAGYDSIMPSFRGVLDQGQLQALVAYVRELSAAPPPGAAVPTSPSMEVSP